MVDLIRYELQSEGLLTPEIEEVLHKMREIEKAKISLIYAEGVLEGMNSDFPLGTTDYLNCYENENN